jgi:hypothetical protein
MTKDYFVVVSRWKIAYQGLKSLLSKQEHLSRQSQSFLHSLMPEKSSGVWKDTFYFHKPGKVLRSLK